MRRVVLLALIALTGLAAVPVSAQSFHVVNFGDSITWALPFDLGGSSGCQSGNPDTCGIPGRLASSSYYRCGSADCSFANRGKAGETSSQGVSRIDQVLRERSWSLAVLMQGTNDLADGVSPQTVAFNLDRMADKAESRGVGVARASIIWFNPSIPKDQTSAQNDAVSSLRGKISSSASADRHCFVDASSQLCPAGSQQAACFQSSYWVPPAETIDHVGHPNPHGYDKLAAEFYRVLGSAGEPGAVEIEGPTGDACGDKLLVEWRKETQARKSCGNWFRVQIDGPGGNKMDRWFQEDGICGSSTCNLTAPVKLKEGSHAVRIQTRNTAGYGPWSDELDFNVIPTAPNQIKKLREPAGEVFGQGGVEAEFKWKPVDEVDDYRLEVKSGSGFVFDESVTGSIECSDTECVFGLSESLASGRYTWRVLAANLCGGTWSEAVLFEVFDGPPAIAPAIEGPSQRVFDDTPILRWKPVDGATEYEVEDPLGNLSRLGAAEACTGDTCRMLSAALAAGDHTWRVRAINPLGEGAWSPFIGFEVAECDCAEGTAAGGAKYLMAVPEAWNGDLVIWSHGSNFFGVSEVEDFGPLAQVQFDEGYALATSAFGVSGWPLFRSERDLEKLFSLFTNRFGRPGRVYLAGESTGALVTAMALETAKLGNVVGALAMCGPLAGLPNWEGVLDLRLAYDVVCAGVAGAGIEGGAEGLANDHQLEPVDVAAAVNFCSGVDKPKSARTNAEKQRLKQLLAVTGLLEEGLQQAMQLATFGLTDLVRDKKKLRGKLPVGNEGVDYDSTDLDREIERVKPNGQAEAKMERFSQVSGGVKDAKVVSLHTSLDPIFFLENEREYADLVPAENLLTGIATESKASHCGFEEVEQLAAWKTLTVWAEGGKQPKAKNLQRRCKQLKSVAEGTCRFQNKPRIEPLDTRIRPRP